MNNDENPCRCGMGELVSTKEAGVWNCTGCGRNHTSLTLTAREREDAAATCPVIAQYEMLGRSHDAEAAQNRQRRDIIHAVRDYAQKRLDAVPMTTDEHLARRAPKWLKEILKMLKEGE